jgi:hypothetical protein
MANSKLLQELRMVILESVRRRVKEVVKEEESVQEVCVKVLEFVERNPVVKEVEESVQEVCVKVLEFVERDLVVKEVVRR